MALSVVQAKSANSDVPVASVTITPSSPTTTGSLLVLLVVPTSETTGSMLGVAVSDSSDQTWTEEVPVGGVPTGQEFWLQTAIYFVANAESISSVTVTLSDYGETESVSAFLYEVAGAATSGPLDQTGTKSSLSSESVPSVAASGATAQASEIAFAAFQPYNDTSLSASGWTFDNSLGADYAFGAYQILTAVQTPVCTTAAAADYYVASIATFKAAGGGGGGTETINMVISKRVPGILEPIRRLWTPRRRIFVPQLVTASAV